MDPPHKSAPNIYSDNSQLHKSPDMSTLSGRHRAKSTPSGRHHRSPNYQSSHHRYHRSGSSPYYSDRRVKSLSSASKSGSKYNPVQLSKSTYIGDHHPTGVQFHGGSFTWRMNHDPRRFNKKLLNNYYYIYYQIMV